MSFNRGIKRNSFGNNRNFNRTSGNMPAGGSLMGGSGSGASRGVNPWESGVMPGRGILPTPNNNLSLNSPQAQLVIASNLLSNLLRTQQDQPQLPSLMSINNSANGPNSNFRGQQSFGGQGRFNDRAIRTNVKNQRNQPYNKMGNRARDGIAGRRGPSSAQQSRAQSQSGNQRQNGNQNQHRNDKNSKANTGSKPNQTKKQEQQDVKNSDNEKPDTETVVKSEENVTESLAETGNEAPVENETGDKPMETPQSEEKPAEEQKTEANDKPTLPEKKNEDGQSGKKSEARHAESRYSAVPISHMVCHVCNKRMWDGFSFENHLRGRAHQLMMDKLDESYKLKVDLMRHELRVAEEQREMSLNNSKRRGKKVSVDLNVREYCTMCDLNFYGTLSSHRKSEKHQQLKTFLHPRCFPCVKEFPSRIEYDEHCLTPQHMLNAIQNDEQKKAKKNKLVKGESEVRTGEDEERDVGSDSKVNDKEEELPENIEYLTDIVENMDMTKYKVPSYKYCRSKQIGLGASLVKEVQGFHCEKCRRFMATQQDMLAHLKTLTHYRNFVNEVKALTVPPAPVEAPQSEVAEDKPEEVNAEELENPCKRPKLEEDVKDDEKPEEEEREEDKAGDETTKNDGNDKYDPLEADAESDDEGKDTKEDEPNQNNEEKGAEVWEEMDNENESEVGNLIDGDEKQDTIPAPTKQPVSSSSSIPEPPEPPIISKPGNQVSIQIQTPTQSQTPTQNSNQSTPNQNSNQTLIHSAMHTPGKTPRGRGFRGGGGGGRGGQRARRSRR